MPNQHVWRVFLERVCFTTESYQAASAFKLYASNDLQRSTSYGTQWQANVRDHSRSLDL